MLSYFCRKRKGSITIMISVVLIAVLSMSSTLLEIARYRSMERIFKEVEENAAFSMLSHYDRDLYDNFGLLALSQDMNQEDFEAYLEKNLSGLQEEDLSGIDQLLELTEDIEFDKLYDLAQIDVLRSQITEFTAYRAPASLVNNALNLEELIGSLVKEIQNDLPILKLMHGLLNLVNSLLNTCLEVGNLSDKRKNMKSSEAEYQKSLEDYNKAVEARKEYIEKYENDSDETESEDESDEENSENSNKMSEEEYQNGLKEKNNAVKNCAVALQSKIKDFKEKIAEYYEQCDKFRSTVSNLMDADEIFKTTRESLPYEKMTNERDENGELTDNAKAAKATIEMVNGFEADYNRSKSMFGKLSSAISQVRDAQVMDIQNRLELQFEKLDKEAEELSNVNEVTLYGIGGWATLLQIILDVTAFVERMVKELREGLKTLGEAVEILSLFTERFPEIKNNNIISNAYMNSLAGHLNNGSMRRTENPYESQDELLVRNQIAKTENVAGRVGFDVNTLQIGNVPGEDYRLQNAIERHYNAIKAFIGASQKVTGWLNLLPWALVKNLINLVMAAIEYIESAIEMCTVLADAMSNGGLAKLMYQRLYIASYSCDMFSNCTTESGDKRMNGSSFFDFYTLERRDDCFDSANAEYIFCGGNNEEANVWNVIRWILILRCVCNVPAVLNNGPLMSIVTPTVAMGVGIILFLLFVLVEAVMDVFFLWLAGASVPLVKVTGFLTPEGIKDVGERLKGILKSNNREEEMQHFAEEQINRIYPPEEVEKAKKKEENEKKENENKGDYEKAIEKWEKGLLEWDYKDHLFFMLLIAKSNDQMLTRCADLIDMQMRKVKKEKGKIESFELQKMATCIRVDVTAAYEPVLPVPIVSGLNDRAIHIESMRYSGY